ncbi:MAG: tetratricopeptide repeat protein [Cyanobacteria bacterium J06642_2]
MGLGLSSLFQALYAAPVVLQVLMFGFWFGMMYHCLKREGGRSSWIYILIFLNLAGAALYFLVKVLPTIDIPQIAYFSRWTRQAELRQAEAEARNIGKAYQYIKLGRLLYDLKMPDKAAGAFATALDKEPNNAEALWGATVLDLDNKQFAAAREKLSLILEVEPDFRRGDASLAYGKVLFELEDWPAARQQLERDIKRWGNAESYLLLARILEQEGAYDRAKSHLETMLARSQGTYEFQYKRNRPYLRQAERMLNRLART